MLMHFHTEILGVIHGRQTVRNRKFKCAYCRRQSVKPQVKKMGNLPACRLGAGVVFQNTGVDFFGQMLIKEKRSTPKVYGCLRDTCIDRISR